MGKAKFNINELFLGFKLFFIYLSFKLNFCRPCYNQCGGRTTHDFIYKTKLDQTLSLSLHYLVSSSRHQLSHPTQLIHYTGRSCILLAYTLYRVELYLISLYIIQGDLIRKERILSSVSACEIVITMPIALLNNFVCLRMSRDPIGTLIVILQKRLI